MLQKLLHPLRLSPCSFHSSLTGLCALPLKQDTLWPGLFPLPKFPGICVASPLTSFTSLFSPHLLNETPVGCPTTAHLHPHPQSALYFVSFQNTHPLLTNNRELAILTVLCFSMSSLGPPSPLLAPMLECVQLLCPQYGSRPWHS